LPVDVDVDRGERELAALGETRTLRPRDLPPLAFDPARDIVFDFGPPLPGHANGLVFAALDAQGNALVAETYYSIGGGFVVTAAARRAPALAAWGDAAPCPYPFDSAAAMLRMARESRLSIAAMKRENERSVRAADAVEQGIARIWSAMDGCIERGLMREG